MHLIFAAVEDPAWEPGSFPYEPGQVPCGRGIQVSNGVWSEMQLGRSGLDRPKHLYGSHSLELGAFVDGGRALTIRSQQDFDCDGVAATSEEEGIFYRGQYVLGGGWKAVRLSLAPLYE
jgi:hypothetical protein